MCGIIGFIGKKSASPILLEGLRRLEYRGYDSAGVALLHEGALLLRKKKGKINDGLARLLKSEPVAGNLGIGPSSQWRRLVADSTSAISRARARRFS